MSENRSLKYFVKRIVLSDLGQIVEVEFYNEISFKPEDMADFVDQYNMRRAQHRAVRVKEIVEPAK